MVNTKIEIDTTMNVVIGDEYIFGNESFIASASQTKTKTFQSASGCDSVVNLTLVVDTPKAITSNDGPYCKDAIVHFSATNVPTDATLEWNGPASLEDNTISSPIINGAKISHSGKYTLKITRNGISFDAEPCELVVSTKMEVDTTINILIGDKINFGNEEIIASKTHTVTKTFQSKSGCDSIVNMTLVVDTPIVITSNAGPYCEGEDASLTASNIPDNATIEWDGPNGFSSNETSPVINNTKPTNSGEYNLKITRNGVSFMATPCELVINPKYNLDTTVHVVIGDKVTIGDKEIIAEKSEIINFSLKTANGCDSIINLSMVVDTPIVVTANSGPYCEGETAILSATNLPDDATFSWSGSNGFSSTEASPKISDVQTTNNGEYKLKITKNGISFMAQPCQLIVNKRYKIDTTMVIAGGESISFGNETLQSTTTKTHTFTSKNGCDSIVTLQLIVVDVITSNSGSICQGGDISFSATGVPDGAQLKWTGPNEFTSEDREPTIKNAQPKNSGEYKLQVTIKGKTYDAKSNSVLVHPTSDIDSFIILSKGNQINFGGILISETGDYHSTFTTVNGCDSTVNLHLIALDLQTSNSGPYCEGESIQLTAENVPDSIESMKWTGPNGFSSSKNVATIKNASVSNSGTYLFSIEMNGNTYEAPSTLVEVHPNVTMKLFQELAFGSTLQFGELVIEKSGNYEQSFTTLEGCDSIVNMTVKVVFPESVAIVPSTHVSPNGDGFNDVWIIENVERYPNSVVTIFDRNGKQLMEYKSYENSNGWDGTDGRGNALPSTDYWYTINIPETDKVYVGHFTLIRK
ncbi:MAG TPA: T9SS type B sorting domain-containing protein [Paludibacteraceae bacterium]|nr:T9SS type B sorting domain-containing protein [Paludibacteraceae bacterium]HPH63883.1 T9SS type B sorting domain-containing protein [Paludibacteraceae bacterium]